MNLLLLDFLFENFVEASVICAHSEKTVKPTGELRPELATPTVKGRISSLIVVISIVGTSKTVVNLAGTFTAERMLRLLWSLSIIGLPKRGLRVG